MTQQSDSPRTWWQSLQELGARRIEISWPAWLNPKRLVFSSLLSSDAQLAVLRLLEVAARHQLDAPSLLRTYAQETSWSTQSQLEPLLERLERGEPLADAVEATPGILKPADRLGIRYGVQSGTLAASLQDAMAGHEQTISNSRLRLTDVLVYAGVVALFMTLTAAFIVIVCFPKLAQIHQEFGRPLNWEFETIRGVTDSIGRRWGLILVAGLVWAWLAWSGELSRWWRRSRLTRRLWAPLDPRPAELWRYLATSSCAGRPLIGGISTLARYHYDPDVRQSLLFARNEIEHGCDPWLALRQVGLLNDSQQRLLTLGSSADSSVGVSSGWLLNLMAQQADERRWRCFGIWTTLARVALVLFLGAIVLMFAMAVFAPIVQLILDLS